jgi:hypothetical protein
MNEIRDKLSALHKLLQFENEVYKANQIENALAGSDDDLKEYITSNELWGGSGSIADLAPTNPSVMRKLETVLAELGEIQIKKGLINTRMEMWTKAFKEWKKMNK